LFDKDGNLICSGYWNNDNFVGKKNYNEYMWFFFFLIGLVIFIINIFIYYDYIIIIIFIFNLW
jgi:hypothetical protein